MNLARLTIDEKRLLLAEYERNRYKYYIPNFSGEAFIRELGEATKRIYLLMAANGFGKTSLAVVILANIFWENKNQFFRYKLFDKWELPKNIWYVSKHTTLKNAVSPEIKKWFPEGRYELREREGYPVQLTTDTGFQVDFLRYDQDIDSFESATVGLVAMDEPCIERIFNAAISRLRMGGVVLWAMTPLLKAGFVKDRIIEGNDYAYVHTADVWENSIERRGVLTKENIDFMISQMSPEEREARAYGKLMVLAGLVLKMFNRKIHTIAVEDVERLFIPQVFGHFEEWPRVMVIDPHDRKPDCVIWAALAPDGTWIVYDEYPDQDFWEIRSRTDDIKQVLRKCFDKENGVTVKEWKALLKSGKPSKIMRRVMDRRKGAQNVSDAGQTLRDTYQLRAKEIGNPISMELSFDDHNKIDHTPIYDVLNYQKSDDGIMLVRPKLLIMRDCKNTIKAFEHYSWDDWNANEDDKKPLREQVQQKYKHPIDCIRYLLGENIQYQRVTPRRENRGYKVNQEKSWMAE